ncbi:hypothetical protein thsrh120_62750 [Rhizobium sp. No.120]
MANWTHILCEFFDRAVDKIAGQRNKVGVKIIDCANDLFHISPLNSRPDMNVAYLDDGEAFQSGIKFGDRDVDRLHSRAAPRKIKAEQCESEGNERHSKRRGIPQPIRDRGHV